MDFDSFLARVVDRSVWWHVEREWSFIHVSDEVKWVALFITAIDDEGMKSHDLVIIWKTVVPELFSVEVTDCFSS